MVRRWFPQNRFWLSASFFPRASPNLPVAVITQEAIGGHLLARVVPQIIRRRKVIIEKRDSSYRHNGGCSCLGSVDVLGRRWLATVVYDVEWDKGRANVQDGPTQRTKRVKIRIWPVVVVPIQSWWRHNSKQHDGRIPGWQPQLGWRYSKCTVGVKTFPNTIAITANTDNEDRNTVLWSVETNKANADKVRLNSRSRRVNIGVGRR